jgi:Na+/H+ antiporter NhaD/arsenite permease-like protein
MMGNWPAIAAATIFISVFALIITEKTHLMIAGLLGALLLVLLNILSLEEAIAYISRSHATLALFLGVMIMVRVFQPTRIFEYLATQIVILAKGQGKRLLAPLVPPMAEELNVNFVPLLILMVFVANSAGLLTIIGDPATFIVGDAVNISFLDYLWKLSLGGAIAIITILLLLPRLFPSIWHAQLEHPEELPKVRILHPRILAPGGIIVAIVLLFFIIGELLPIPISPATVAILGATLCLLLCHHSKTDSVPNVLKDVDWSTLIFFMSIFVLIGGLEKTGVINSASGVLAVILGKNIALGSILLLFSVGLLSSLIPNIPLVVAMVPLLKQYVVTVGLASPAILDPNFAGQFPPEVLPLFYAMMYGATLGGNGTLVGASSNIVAAGIAEQHGKRISFKTFLKYGIPVMLCQLVTAALYVVVRFLVFR